MSVAAGRLNTPLELLRRVETRDAAGQRVDAWEVYETGLRGEVLFVSGREGRSRGDRVETTTSHRVTMRHVAGVTPAMRVRAGRGENAQLYDIDSVGDPDGRGRVLVLECNQTG